MITLYIKGQELKVNQCTIASDTIDYITVKANFMTADWNGLSKVVHFKQGENDYAIVLDSDNEIKENQHLNLSSGTYEVWIHGNDDNKRITTTISNVTVQKTGSQEGEPPIDVPLSVGEQILQKAENAENTANEVKNLADSGAFDGEDGADGKDGTDGQDGNGIDRIEKVSTSGLVDTYRIYFTDGTTYDYTVTNGEDKGTRDYNELENKPFKYLDLSASNVKINELENGNYIVKIGGNIYDPNGNKILQDESLVFTLLIGDRIYKSDLGAEITIQDGTYYSLDFTNFSYYMTKADHDTDINDIKSEKQDKLNFTGNISLTGEDNNIPNADIPTKISAFENDSNYQSAEQVKDTVSPVADDIANYLEVADILGIWKNATAGRTDFLHLFENSTVKTIPMLDTSSGKNFSYMFKGCSQLETVPLLDTSNATNMLQMFYGCSSLKILPAFNMSKVTNMFNLVYNCTSITSFKGFDTSNVTNMNGMFYGCTSLEEVGIDTSSVTNGNYLFYHCTSLKTVKTLDFSNVASLSGQFYRCLNLESIEFVPESIRLSVSMSDCSKLNAESVASIFAGLADLTDSETQTLTLHKNVQITQAQADAAVAKNWNVVGGTVNG